MAVGGKEGNGLYGGGSKIEKKRKQTMSLMTALLAKLKSPFLDSRRNPLKYSDNSWVHTFGTVVSVV